MKRHIKDHFHCQVCDGTCSHSLVYMKNGIPIYRCDTCGAGRARIDGFEPGKYYTEEYFNGGYEESYVDYPGSEETLRQEFRKIVQYLCRMGVTEGTCLEIGCAYGFFLQEAKSYYDVYGVEVANVAVQYCHETGLTNVRKGELTRDFLDKVGTLDVVVMLDVIEHIDKIDDVIGLVSSFLKPGAILLLTTGDWSSPLARLAGKSWRLMAPPGHLWYLTADSLKVLMGRHDMIQIDISHPWKIVPFELIVKQAAKMLAWGRPVHFPASFRKIGIPANLFDSMRIAYRKVG